MSKLLDKVALWRFWICNVLWMAFWNSVFTIYEVYYDLHLNFFGHDVVSFTRGILVTVSYFLADWFLWGGKHYRSLNGSGLGRWLRPRHWWRGDPLLMLAVYDYCEKHQLTMVVWENTTTLLFGFETEDQMVHCRMSV